MACFQLRSGVLIRSGFNCECSWLRTLASSCITNLCNTYTVYVLHFFQIVTSLSPMLKWIRNQSSFATTDFAIYVDIQGLRLVFSCICFSASDAMQPSKIFSLQLLAIIFWLSSTIIISGSEKSESNDESKRNVCRVPEL